MTTGIVAAVLTCVASFFWGLRWPIVTQLLNITIDSAHRATIISLGSFSNHLGFALCAPIFGFVTDLHGIKVAFRIAAFCSLLLVPVFGQLQTLDL